jgi:hypothetical protein
MEEMKCKLIGQDEKIESAFSGQVKLGPLSFLD